MQTAIASINVFLKQVHSLASFSKDTTRRILEEKENKNLACLFIRLYRYAESSKTHFTSLFTLRANVAIDLALSPFQNIYIMYTHTYVWSHICTNMEIYTYIHTYM